MSELKSILTIFSVLILNARSANNCENDFKDSYMRLKYHLKSSDDQIQLQKLIMADENGPVDGIAYYSICEKIKVPENCVGEGQEATHQSAKFVFVHDNDKKCIIIQDSEDWKYEIDGAQPSNSVFVKHTSKDGYNILYNFVCSLPDHKTNSQVTYSENSKTFRINVTTDKACLIEETPTITSIFLGFLETIYILAIGVFLCFFGLQMFKNHIEFFAAFLSICVLIPVYECLIGIFKPEESTTVYIIISIAAAVASTASMIYLPNFFQIILCILVSSGAALEVSLYICLRYDLSMLMVVFVLIFVIFLVSLIVMQIYAKEHCLIITTSFLGCKCLLIGLAVSNIIKSFDIFDKHGHSLVLNIIFDVVWIGGGIYQLMNMKAVSSQPEASKDIENSLHSE